MPRDTILSAINAEIKRLEQARNLLEAEARPATKRAPEKRRMSAAARKKIAEGQKRRWAKQKAAK